MANVAARLRADAQLLDARDHGHEVRLATSVPGGCGPVKTTPAPTPSPTPCTGWIVAVVVTTDGYHMETSWDMTDQCGVGGQGGLLRRDEYDRPDTRYLDTYCLPPARYKFTIRDEFGDGICCQHGDGGYEVFLNGASQFAGDGQFGATREHEFGSCASEATPPPTPAPTPAPTAPLVPPPTSLPVADTPAVPSSPSATTSPTGTRTPTSKGKGAKGTKGTKATGKRKKGRRKKSPFA